jgi:hypothetical protein
MSCFSALDGFFPDDYTGQTDLWFAPIEIWTVRDILFLHFTGHGNEVCWVKPS